MAALRAPGIAAAGDAGSAFLAAAFLAACCLAAGFGGVFFAVALATLAAILSLKLAVFSARLDCQTRSGSAAISSRLRPVSTLLGYSWTTASPLPGTAV